MSTYPWLPMIDPLLDSMGGVGKGGNWKWGGMAILFASRLQYLHSVSVFFPFFLRQYLTFKYQIEKTFLKFGVEIEIPLAALESKRIKPFFLIHPSALSFFQCTHWKYVSRFSFGIVFLTLPLHFNVSALEDSLPFNFSYNLFFHCNSFSSHSFAGVG